MRLVSIIGGLFLLAACATGVSTSDEGETEAPPTISGLDSPCEPGEERSCDECGVRRCTDDGAWEATCSDLDAMCASGDVCEAGQCIAPKADCTISCTGAAGEAICAGHSGFAPCLENGIRRCTCGKTGEFVDCEPLCYH